MWDSIAPPRVQRLKLSDRRSEEQFGLNIFSRNIMNDCFKKIKLNTFTAAHQQQNQRWR